MGGGSNLEHKQAANAPAAEGAGLETSASRRLFLVPRGELADFEQPLVNIYRKAKISKISKKSCTNSFWCFDHLASKPRFAF